MINQQQANEIKEVVEGFLDHMDMEAEVEIGKPEDDTIPVDLEMENPQNFDWERR